MSVNRIRKYWQVTPVLKSDAWMNNYTALKKHDIQIWFVQFYITGTKAIPNMY